ncbi:MFS transporter [Pseudofrankia sp. DC12]|uniref:MFS transporter n=1 Tax=Pseudofrankia sp. DC12 TaxID=683315 RepID=UPI0006961331|nr:MFS transporter [Pseudofrankia sp. DC12]
MRPNGPAPVAAGPAAPVGVGGHLPAALWVLYAGVFVVMVGYGITLTVIPYQVERIHELRALRPATESFHIGLLTSVYALAQLVASPAAGWLCDRVGRRPILLVGLAGMAATQAPFGFVSWLPGLYLLRAGGGVATSGVLIAAIAYVADSTSEAGRARGMAWFGTSVSLGLVAGPALGGLLSGPAISRRIEGPWLNGFSLPFLAAGLLALAVLIASTRRVPESRRLDQRATAALREVPQRRPSGLRGLLSLVTASSAGLALFEGTFVLYGQSRLGIGPAQASVAFMVCGLVMAALQVAAAGALSRFVAPTLQVAAGLVVMGIGIAAIVVTRHFAVVLGVVALLAAGSAVVTPNLSVLVSAGRGDRAGAALGMKSAANSAGQFVGPLAGVALLSWRPASPFVLAGGLLAVLGAVVGILHWTRPGHGRGAGEHSAAID